MATVTREEVLKIAKMSKMELLEEEIAGIVQELNAVLSYAERVCEIAADVEIVETKNSNVMREDIVKPTNPQPILAQAPSTEDNYFIVPKILEND